MIVADSNFQAVLIPTGVPHHSKMHPVTELLNGSKHLDQIVLQLHVGKNSKVHLINLVVKDRITVAVSINER